MCSCGTQHSPSTHGKILELFGAFTPQAKQEHCLRVFGFKVPAWSVRKTKTQTQE